MNYNQFSYYRANPFYSQGYVPPRAHKNRGNAEYLAHLPQGEEDFLHGSRKQYSQMKSCRITEEKLLSSDNLSSQIIEAKSKEFVRNLETSDIQGAYSSPVRNMALRNKLRAREMILNREQESEQVKMEAQKRKQEQYNKKFLKDQFEKNFHINQLISQQSHSYTPGSVEKHENPERKSPKMQNYHTIESSTPQESYKYYEGDRRMHRMLQPSLLSAENTMQLAGRNIVSK